MPSETFIGLRTFMHSTEAADEPGVVMGKDFGMQQHAEPTITIPSDVATVWAEASELDGFVEIDSHIRTESAMISGGNTYVPYQQNLEILSVTVFDTVNLKINTLQSNEYTLTNGEVLLIGYPNGTAFTVSYKASPVYVAWRRAGGNVHTRPYGGGTDALPIRFRAMLLDVWTRARNGNGNSASPQAILR